MWPSPSEIASTFGTVDFGKEHSCARWFQGVYEWIDECQTSQREYWALVLAYVGRQLGYTDVIEDQATLDRVVAVAKRAVDALDNL